MTASIPNQRVRPFTEKVHLIRWRTVFNTGNTLQQMDHLAGILIMITASGYHYRQGVIVLLI